ncbi:MAG: hypothetical protein JWL96_2851 [Sphingomonas bacterium]|uniref:EAL domain-containing protein n=1 Tax=Sphingomonas bacterium TaxID=1895847 RepID=UPI00260338DE|nr:EAL domain-containing protein [Sphingomonas bacterium]MDB5710781.1 hypothetical protein [Sphingomonas bacterium]
MPLALPIALFVAVVAAAWLSGQRARTRREITALFAQALDRVARGERNVRLEACTWGETARMVSAFNVIAAQQEEKAPAALGHSIDRGMLFHRLRSELHIEDEAETAASFVGIVEINRFAGLRRKVGIALANRVLQHIGERMRATLAQCEIGRVGRTSIEFAFRAGDATTAEAALEVLARELEQRIEIDGFTFDLPISIGFADSSEQRGREEILDHAAAAVARAQAERKRVCYAADAPEIDQAYEDLALMRDLPRAIAAGELELYYQPKLRARTETIDSAEALLRWFSPTRGQVTTERLIELAEDTGAIHDLTEWVVRRAVADQQAMAAAGHDLVIYVNISGVLLPEENFATRVLEMVAAAPGRIGFEITETAVIKDPDGALANLHRFVAAGIKIAIDDYGSGLSSLAYLKQLPANELKIDRMFVSGLIDSHRDPLLVRSSIDLAHALEMEVTAEGVDNMMVLSLLRVMGCDLIQGFLVSQPLPLPKLLAFLDNEDHLSHLAAQPISVPGQWPAAAG